MPLQPLTKKKKQPTRMSLCVQPLTADGPVKYEDSSCGIYGRQCDTETGLSPITSVCPVNVTPLMLYTHCSIYRWRYIILATDDVVKQYAYKTVSSLDSLTTACPKNNVTPTVMIPPAPCTSTQCCNNHTVCRSRVRAARSISQAGL